MIKEFKRVDPPTIRQIIGKTIIIILTLVIGIIAYNGLLNYDTDEVNQAQFYICSVAFIGGIVFNIYMYFMEKTRTILYVTYDSISSEIIICTIKGVKTKSNLKDIKYFYSNIGEVYDIKMNRKTYLGVGFLSNYQELKKLILENCKGIYP